MNTPDTPTGTTTRSFFESPTEQGWAGFVDRYGPRIYAWCRGKGLQQADAEDVSQEVLLRVYRSMTRAPWDAAKGRLRVWLNTVTRNALSDFVRSPAGLGNAQRSRQAEECLASLAVSPDDFVNQLAEEEQRQRALAWTEVRVGPKKWQVFRLQVMENKSAQEVADLLGFALGTVHNYTSAVGQALKEELAKLEAD